MGLGANLGSAESSFLDALDRLRPCFHSLQVAPLYRSLPDSPLPQPAYLNTVAVGRPKLEAEELLAVCKALERLAGRRRGPRFGPRPLDLDLLLWGRRVLRSRALTLPHPRLRRRRFVLAPLADVVPDLQVPPDGATVRSLLESLPAEPAIEMVTWHDPRRA